MKKTEQINSNTKREWTYNKDRWEYVDTYTSGISGKVYVNKYRQGVPADKTEDGRGKGFYNEQV